MHQYLLNPLSQLPGLTPQKAQALAGELALNTWADLLYFFPYRYENRQHFEPIAKASEGDTIQLKGTLTQKPELVGTGFNRRLVAIIQDSTATIELVWFKPQPWLEKKLIVGLEYVAYGKVARYGGKYSIAHPELDVFTQTYAPPKFLNPVYSLTEGLRKKKLDRKAIESVMQLLFKQVYPYLEENLPESIIDNYRMVSRKVALLNVHFPKSQELLEKAKFRIKFEELFFLQIGLLQTNYHQKEANPGLLCPKTDLVHEFYLNHLKFQLTGAQKRVLKEIHHDLNTGQQMNRLLQGDVGSGKTIVAFVAALMAISNGYQAALMAPTEILTEQHAVGLGELAALCGIPCAKLTGNTKKKERDQILAALKSGELKLIIGTHALLTDTVIFNNLALCIIDEQHRFGVAQRAKLWAKGRHCPPHVLVMTATPIPRTLAMTLYGDLDVSIIDELPPGRKPITTRHMYDTSRERIFDFMKKEIALGRQVYVVFPLIEESEKIDFENLQEGFQRISEAFPTEQYLTVMVHGKMSKDERDAQMQLFIEGKAQIMVATTVIEVGVNVPNASVMVIESAERFGLSQLHQLRGRVGRGADQSYCLLVTGVKLSKESFVRLETMERTTDGFEIADVDLRLRGPGDLAGTQQSGVVDLHLTDLSSDAKIVELSRQAAKELIAADPKLELPEHLPMQHWMHTQKMRKQSEWRKIS